MSLGSGPIATGAPTARCSLLKHTFKHAPHCDGAAEAPSGSGGMPRGAGALHVYPLLITGVGRSATKFMQESLKIIGAQVNQTTDAPSSDVARMA